MTLKDVRNMVMDALKGEEVDEDVLAKTLYLAKQVYYNSGEGLPEKVVSFFEENITDQIFDHLEDVLRDMNPNHKYFRNNTGAPVPENKSTNASMRKVTLPVPMPSLNKIKPGSKALGPFLKQGPFVVSAKVDGVSILIRVKEDGTRNLYTRGNGSVGQDISHLWNDLHLPKKVKGPITIRGEMIISKAAFEANKKAFGKKDKEAKNARNTMSGLVNSGEASPLFRHVDVLCYAVIGKKPSEAFPLLEHLGFKTPFWQMVPSLDEESIDKWLEVVKKKDYEYDADGLVVSKNVVERPTTENPTNTLAYKNNAISDTKVFTVKEVIWQPSKHGKLKPVLSLEPQSLNGVTISKCTAFNGEYVEENKLGPGAKVKLVRSGDVIPHVLEVVEEADEAQMPEDYIKKGADIYVVDQDDNETVAIKKITFFFKYLGAEGISKKFFEKMYEEGYTTLEDILTITKKQLLAIPGIQTKSANSIHAQIQKVKEASLADYMAASGCFPATIASTRINTILEHYPDILMEPKAKIFEKVASLSGFSRITTQDFTNGAEKFKKWIKDLAHILEIKEPKKVEHTSDRFKDLVVCPTGFRFDNATKQFIEENGGKVQTSMTKDTTIVVTKDLGSSSSKIQKAKEKGIKVMSLEAFKEQLGI